MKSFDSDMPDDFHLENEENKIYLVAKLFEAGKLTIVQASEMAGLERSDFMKKLCQYEINFFNYPSSELTSDMQNAKEGILENN